MIYIVIGIFIGFILFLFISMKLYEKKVGELNKAHEEYIKSQNNGEIPKNLIKVELSGKQIQKLMKEGVIKVDGIDTPVILDGFKPTN